MTDAKNPRLIALAAFVVSIGIGPSFAQQKSTTPVIAPASTQVAQVSAPNYSWTGLYFGINGGFAGGSYQYSPIEIEALKENEPQEPTLNKMRNSASGGFLGAQIGYLYQFSNSLVLGIETDLQGGSYLSSGTASEFSSETNTAETEQAKLKTTYLGTIRGRLGYAFDPLLPYVTAGAAYGRTQTMFAEGEAEQGQPPYAKSGRTNWGYAVGGGAEYAFAPAWRLKAEYLYTSLSSYQATGLENASFKLPTRLSIFRIGLNYAFGHETSATELPYATPALGGSAASYGGFSVGVLGGLAIGSARVSGLTVDQGNTEQVLRKMNAAGGLAGVEIGYNMTIADRVVVGVLADYQAVNGGIFASESEIAANEAEREKLRISVPQFGTVRARIGYNFGALIPYATAGFAYGKAEFRDSVMPLEEGTAPGRANALKAGYALGLGVEYLITANISLKSEYLFVDLGTFSARDTEGAAIKSPLQTNIGRVGLTYRF